jgi:hypothetical protein
MQLVCGPGENREQNKRPPDLEALQSQGMRMGTANLAFGQAQRLCYLAGLCHPGTVLVSFKFIAAVSRGDGSSVYHFP